MMSPSLRRAGLVVGSLAAGAVMGAGILLAWLLGGDLDLGFEMVGTRVLECLTR